MKLGRLIYGICPGANRRILIGMAAPDTTDEFDDDDSLPLRELRRLAGGRCVECGTGYTAREAVGAVALGFKAAPRCLACLSRRLDRDADELRSELVAYVHRRECFLKAWREAERMDGGGWNPSPSPLGERERGEGDCLPPPLVEGRSPRSGGRGDSQNELKTPLPVAAQPTSPRRGEVFQTASVGETTASEPLPQSPSPLTPLPPGEEGTKPHSPGEGETIHWNAGDLGCGELVMELRLRLAALPPGGEIDVTATDPAAPEDLPSWCRMTGHSLVSATHPHYRIRRKEK